MEIAIAEAIKAESIDEVPIGAIAVTNNQVIAKAHNIREATNNPLGHAEILLINKLTKKKHDWRFEDVTIYVTCEPCIMCTGAMLQARIPKLVFGCFDPKAGACGSVYNLTNNPKLNHQIQVTSGILKNECSKLLKDFFKKLRREQTKD